MPISPIKLPVLVLFAFFLVVPHLATATDLATCLKQVADEDLNQKVSFQGKMRDIIVEKQADLQPLANLQHDYQVALGQSRNGRLKYLVDNQIKRVSINELSQFRNFDWDEEDQRAFLNADKKNQAQQKIIWDLKKKNQNHPDWPKLREFMGKHLRGSKEFQDLMKTFTTTQTNTEGLLKNCGG